MLRLKAQLVLPSTKAGDLVANLHLPTGRDPVGPGAALSIVGVPFGTLPDGRFAMGSRAAVASDPDLKLLQPACLPCGLAKSTGQAGPPLIQKANGTPAARTVELLRFWAKVGPSRSSASTPAKQSRV